MIEKEDVIKIHTALIEEFEGTLGVRDLAWLESALARPFMTFEKIGLYPSAIHKAAALLESIVKNHPFMDGNKRTGYVVMRAFLNEEELDIEETLENKYRFVISVASGILSFDQIVEWISYRLIAFEE